jgi:hypothetical protein
MKAKHLFASLACLVVSNIASADLITNGNFETCGFDNWTTINEADGIARPVAPESPFSILDDGTNCSASMFVDDGVTTDAIIAILISDELDLSADVGDTFTLSFDYDFAGTDGDPLFGDYVQFGFEDASGFLFDPSDILNVNVPEIAGYGSDTISMQIDNAYFNQPGWFLRFDLFDIENGGFSSLTLDNISLIRTPADINAPALGSLLFASMGGLFVRKRRSLTHVKRGK